MEHGHSHGVGGAKHAGRLKIALVLTALYLIAEVVGGIITGSLALLSDAAHMLTDVMALAIALVAIHIGQRSADAQRTYGYYRLEILAAAFNAVVLLLVALYILYEAYRRFQSPPEIESGLMLVVAVIGLVVNIISMVILRSGSEESLNVKGAYLEVLSDMLGSVAVIVAALVIRFTGWWPVDPILAVLIGLWVLPRAWTLLSQSMNILLEGVPEEIELKQLYHALATLPNVQEIHDLHVWTITSGQNSMSVHLVAEQAEHSFDLVQAAQQIARDHGIEHASIQVEAPGTIQQEPHVHSSLDV